MGVDSTSSLSRHSSMLMPMISCGRIFSAARPAPRVEVMRSSASVVHRMAGICSTTRRRCASCAHSISRVCLAWVTSRSSSEVASRPPPMGSDGPTRLSRVISLPSLQRPAISSVAWPSPSPRAVAPAGGGSLRLFVQEVGHRQAEQIGRLVAEQPGDPDADEDDAPLLVPRKDVVGGGFEHVPAPAVRRLGFTAAPQQGRGDHGPQGREKAGGPHVRGPRTLPGAGGRLGRLPDRQGVDRRRAAQGRQDNPSDAEPGGRSTRRIHHSPSPDRSLPQFASVRAGRLYPGNHSTLSGAIPPRGSGAGEGLTPTEDAPARVPGRRGWTRPEFGLEWLLPRAAAVELRGDLGEALEAADLAGRLGDLRQGVL